MFGSRKNKIKEQIKEIFAQIDHYKEDFENRISSIAERGKHIQENLLPVKENTTSMTAYAKQNIEEETILLYTLDLFSKEFQTAIKDYHQIVELVKENHDAVTNLVEENKHYTTPSKYLTEVPAKLKEEYQSYEEKTEKLAERAREMSVQALSVAVEAGRMGESGKKFVAASEEFRQMALDCENSVLLMKEELQASQERVQELEECVRHMVALMKEGNVGTTRLMKKYMELNKTVDRSSMRDFSDDVLLMRDKVLMVHNLEEEILKASERNTIQLTDVQEELQNEKQELRELKNDLEYIVDDVQERFVQNDLLVRN